MNNSPKHWLYLHDGKPGHFNQLLGLSEALAAKNPAHTSSWLNVSRLTFANKMLATGAEVRSVPAADVIVAAGHSTHWLTLILGKKFGAHTVVVMRPSWPVAWFDSVIMPKHDAANRSLASNIHVTEGAMNILGSQSYQPNNKGLVLLGGDSKHFDWPKEQVTSQVCTIMRTHPGLEWTVADSRRTPQSQLLNIQAVYPNASLQSHSNCPKGWLVEQMRQANVIWISPDSVSMVYEALSSGAAVGLIELPPKTKNRINHSMLKLIAEGKVSSVTKDSEITLANAPLPRLNETEKAAAWLLSRV